LFVILESFRGLRFYILNLISVGGWWRLLLSVFEDLLDVRSAHLLFQLPLGLVLVASVGQVTRRQFVVDSILKLGLACTACIDNIADWHSVSFHFALCIAVVTTTPFVLTLSGDRLLVHGHIVAVDAWQLHGSY
jgi:hypothetical protein